MKKLGIIVTHPIQYFNELFSVLSTQYELIVFYSHQQAPSDERKTPFGLSFRWSGSLLEGYNYTFLENTSSNKDVGSFFGCNTPQIYKEVSKGNFDLFLVFGWHSFSYIQAILACKLARVPVYIRTDSTLDEDRPLYIKILKKIGYPALLKIPTGFLYVGVKSKAFLRAYGVNPNKLYFSPHSVGSKNFYPDYDVSNLNRKRDKGSYTWKILSVSSLIKLKNIDHIILGCAEIFNQGYNVELHIVGSGEMESKLRQIASKQDYTIHFHSFKNQDELRDFYIKSDIFVLASSSESWGLVVNEAMQCGVPAVVSDSVGCAPDLINSYTGRVFKTGDITDFAFQIIDLINASSVTTQSITDHIKNYSIYSSIKAIESL